MPRPIRVPTMTHHKPSGQARVRLHGRDVYLGPYGSAEAEQEYRRVTAEWLATGCAAVGSKSSSTHRTLTINELTDAYTAASNEYSRPPPYEVTAAY